MSAPILTAALKLAHAGKPVFPCKRNKMPFTTHGFKDATTDTEQIKSWWQKWPDALLAMPTGDASGLLVLDVDLPHGPASLAALEAQHGPLQVTLEASTRSGGRHIYFQHVPGIGCSTGKLGPGLDIRADGGYVIVPPSPGYSWVRGV